MRAAGGGEVQGYARGLLALAGFVCVSQFGIESGARAGDDGAAADGEAAFVALGVTVEDDWWC